MCVDKLYVNYVHVLLREHGDGVVAFVTTTTNYDYDMARRSGAQAASANPSRFLLAGDVLVCVRVPCSLQYNIVVQAHNQFASQAGVQKNTPLLLVCISTHIASSLHSLYLGAPRRCSLSLAGGLALDAMCACCPCCTLVLI